MVVEKQQENHTLEIYLEKRDKIYANFVIDGSKEKARCAGVCKRSDI